MTSSPIRCKPKRGNHSSAIKGIILCLAASLIFMQDVLAVDPFQMIIFNFELDVDINPDDSERVERVVRKFFQNSKYLRNVQVSKVTLKDINQAKRAASGANLIIYGKIATINENYFVNLTLYDLGIDKPVHSESVELRDLSRDLKRLDRVLLEMEDRIVRRYVGKITGGRGRNVYVDLGRNVGLTRKTKLTAERWERFRWNPVADLKIHHLEDDSSECFIAYGQNINKNDRVIINGEWPIWEISKTAKIAYQVYDFPIPEIKYLTEKNASVGKYIRPAYFGGFVVSNLMVVFSYFGYNNYDDKFQSSYQEYLTSHDLDRLNDLFLDSQSYHTKLMEQKNRFKNFSTITLAMWSLILLDHFLPLAEDRRLTSKIGIFPRESGRIYQDNCLGFTLSLEW